MNRRLFRLRRRIWVALVKTMRYLRTAYVVQKALAYPRWTLEYEIKVAERHIERHVNLLAEIKYLMTTYPDHPKMPILRASYDRGVAKVKRLQETIKAAKLTLKEHALNASINRVLRIK
jgi:hypothetical protein